jgi:hypothetical protein
MREEPVNVHAHPAVVAVQRLYGGRIACIPTQKSWIIV